MICPCLHLGHVHKLLIVILGVHATLISCQPTFNVGSSWNLGYKVGYLDASVVLREQMIVEPLLSKHHLYFDKYFANMCYLK